MADLYFTTPVLVTDLMTQLGVNLQLDTTDDPDYVFDPNNPADPGLPTMIWGMRWATNQVKFFVQENRIAADLASNEWVQDQATVFAAYRIAGRGGEAVPKTLKEMYKESKELLDMIRLKQAQIPDLAVAVGKGGGIVMSNFRVDAQRQRPVRVVRPISTGQPQGYPQSIDEIAESGGAFG